MPDPAGAVDPSWGSGVATDDERSLAAALSALEAEQRLADAERYGDDADWDLAAWDLEASTDDSLVEGLGTRAVHAADLLLLASVDPARLSENVLRLEYVAAARRVEAYTASLRFAAEVALVGSRPSGNLMAETAAEHEVAVASTISRYAAGRELENARALCSTFAAFGAALAAGEVSEQHCAVLVERTRFVHDEAALAEIERRALPRARRMPPGRFAREVLALVARFDPDAEARVKRARATRDVYVRPGEDGMAFLGFTHDAPTVQAVYDAIAADGRGLGAGARGRRRSA